MENQPLLNAIATVAGSIDTLVRAGKQEEVTIATAKLLELIAKVK
jgi:hypothetical protein